MNPRLHWSKEMFTIVAMGTLSACSNSTPSGASTPPTSEGAAGGGQGADAGTLREIEVDSQLADCTGVGPQKCLRIRRAPGKDWEFWYAGIEGFEHRAGTKYKLRIREEQVPNPPADGSSIRWILVDVIEQTPAKP